jgi:hypothetical protein
MTRSELLTAASTSAMAARLKFWKDRHYRHAKDLSTEGVRGSIMVALRGEEPTDLNRRDYHLSPS